MVIYVQLGTIAYLFDVLLVKTWSYRFNASLMLESLRGKRMMYVGDSLNRGQYVSMICLLHSLIPEGSKSMETFDSLTIFTAKVRDTLRETDEQGLLFYM